jgi:hypothetical protein
MPKSIPVSWATLSRSVLDRSPRIGQKHHRLSWRSLRRAEYWKYTAFPCNFRQYSRVLPFSCTVPHQHVTNRERPFVNARQINRFLDKDRLVCSSILDLRYKSLIDCTSTGLPRTLTKRYPFSVFHALMIPDPVC